MEPRLNFILTRNHGFIYPTNQDGSYAAAYKHFRCACCQLNIDVGDRREETTKRHRIGLERASQIWIKQSTNVKREATIMNFTARRHASAVNEVSATDGGRKLGGGLCR